MKRYGRSIDVDYLFESLRRQMLMVIVVVDFLSSRSINDNVCWFYAESADTSRTDGSRKI